MKTPIMKIKLNNKKLWLMGVWKRLFNKNLFIFFLSAGFLSTGLSYAQDSYEDLEASPKSGSQETVQIKSLSDLQQITPYTSISVIQKRYLPKTYRAEFNLSLSAVINHTFFYLGGASGRVGFFIREDHGFGLEAFAALPPVFKVVTNNITAPPNNILPSSVILPQLYGGIYYKWTPVFGKFALLDKKIIYFDSYATLGGGMNKVLNGIEVIKEEINRRGLTIKNPRPHSKLTGQVFPAFTFGLGQLFTVNQSWAVNWELKWFYTFVMYEAGRLYTPTDINFSLGINYYFPEAGYR